MAPYQRPPLSKAWLKGEADADSLMLRPESFYVEDRTSTCGSSTEAVVARQRAAKTVPCIDEDCGEAVAPTRR